MLTGKKEPVIKLFGKTILVEHGTNFEADAVILSTIQPSYSAAADTGANPDVDCEYSANDNSSPCSKQGENSPTECFPDSNVALLKVETIFHRGVYITPFKGYSSGEQDEERNSSSIIIEGSKGPTSSSSYEKEFTKENQSEQTSTTQSQDQSTPKKPDKILPCPRCNSMETKFCYFNNYNVNQPRHFCKNCQRYWTAGGTMRNVPVGAGRRKSKSSSSINQRHLVIPEGLRPNGNVLTFGLDSSISELMASSLKHVETLPNGFIGSDMRIPGPLPRGLGNGKENSNAMMSATDSWPCRWNQAPWQSGFPVSFYSKSSHWPYRTLGTGNLQRQPTPNTCTDQALTITSNPSSFFLGKHTRDETMLRSSNCKNDDVKDKKLNPRVLTPKTMKFEGVKDVAKSSIWDSLGIKRGRDCPSNGGSWYFRGLHDLDGAYERIDSATGGISSVAIETNPASFSRSLLFHERANK